MRKIKFILILLGLFSCKQNQEKVIDVNNQIKIIKLKKPEDIKSYIHKVDHRDLLCLHELKLAKAQVNSGKVVFTLKRGEGAYNARQAKRLKELCKNYKLYFDFDEIEDSFENEYERAGCYGAFMDEVIEKKFGVGFREKLLKEADELSIANNDTINAYECDVRSEIYGLETNNVVYLSGKKYNVKRNQHGQFLNLDVMVYVDKAGKVIGYKLNKFMDDNLDSERERLFGVAVKELKKYKECKAGEIRGKKVITKNFVTVNFY